MDRNKPEEGPLFVWNFPLLRRFQRRTGILQMGFQAFSDDQPDSNTDTNTSDIPTAGEVENDKSDDDILDDIESSIEELDDEDLELETEEIDTMSMDEAAEEKDKEF